MCSGKKGHELLAGACVLLAVALAAGWDNVRDVVGAAHGQRDNVVLRHVAHSEGSTAVNALSSIVPQDTLPFGNSVRARSTGPAGSHILGFHLSLQPVPPVGLAILLPELFRVQCAPLSGSGIDPFPVCGMASPRVVTVSIWERILPQYHPLSLLFQKPFQIGLSTPFAMAAAGGIPHGPDSVLMRGAVAPLGLPLFRQVSGASTLGLKDGSLFLLGTTSDLTRLLTVLLAPFGRVACAARPAHLVSSIVWNCVRATLGGANSHGGILY